MNIQKEKTVTITESEYDRLFEDSQMLEALDACGVDNWEGYERAQEMVEEWNASN